MSNVSTFAAQPTCKACGSPRDPMAISVPQHCTSCFACFRCGALSIAMDATPHYCPDSTGARHDVGHLILATGPTGTGVRSHGTTIYIAGG